MADCYYNGKFASARQEQLTAEETDVLIRAVKDQEVALYGDGRNPSKISFG